MRTLETKYRGRRYRSRLEARWAVFLDTLGVPFLYEPEGFDLDGLWYLPDFWLPDQQCYLEIKGHQPMEVESEKAQRLAVTTMKPVFILFGDIPWPEENGAQTFESESAHKWDCWIDDQWPQAGWDCYYRWCECPACGMVGLEFEARADRLPCRSRDCPGDGKRADRGHNPASRRLLAAYTAARSARFEGERDKPFGLNIAAYDGRWTK